MSLRQGQRQERAERNRGTNAYIHAGQAVFATLLIVGRDPEQTFKTRRYLEIVFAVAQAQDSQTGRSIPTESSDVQREQRRT